VKPRLLALLVALLVAAVTLVLGWRVAPPARTPQAGASAEPRPAPVVRAPAPVDPAAIRDIFRFAEPAAPASARAAAGSIRATPGPQAPSATGPRLVGLVRRDGRLLAAFAVDGDVVLAGPGETVAGVTLVAVSEEGVRVRRPDGTEETLALP
jgi:hypothetical protein